MTLSDSATGLSQMVFSDPGGSQFEITYGGSEAQCDADGDDICDDVDSCVGIEDCAGECNGSAVEDCAGECNGSAVEDCAGSCEGSAVVDECGVCEGGGISDGACDCDGNVEDCAGICGGDASLDNCGVCEGDNSSCSTTGILGGCDLPNNTIHYDFNTDEVWYKVDFDIKAFSWDIYPDSTSVNNSYGGSQEDAGFTNNSASSSEDVYAYAFGTGYITDRCGTLINIELNNAPTSDQNPIIFENIVFSNSNSGSFL